MKAEEPANYQPGERRPIASRDRAIIRRIATGLCNMGVSPNAISVASCVFASAAMAALIATSYTTGWQQRLLWLAAAAGVQGRLLANLFDGMVAIQSGKASPVRELYNEMPDRISDPLILIGAGYAIGGSPELGYLAAVVALFVAYVRAVGAHAGAGQQFCGPMAKPHRMFIITMACLYAALTPIAWQPSLTTTGWSVMAVALAIICAGGVITVIRRLMRIGANLRAKV